LIYSGIFDQLNLIKNTMKMLKKQNVEYKITMKDIIRAITYLLKFCGILIVIDILSSITSHEGKSLNIIFDIIFGFLFWILFIFSGKLKK